MKLVIAFFVAMPLLAVTPRSRTQGWCEQGGKTITVTLNGYTTTPKAQGSYPSCTVTIYQTGTTTLASIYSDDAGTAKANPFTADTAGVWFFYADDGRYDVRFSGGGISAPFTRGDFQAFDYRFLQTGAGAVSRLLKDKVAEVVSVKDFGCAGDGVTDDSVCLQAAIDAMAIAGGTVTIPPGLYLYSTTLNIQTQITIEGATETTRYFPRVQAGKSIGSALYYTGSGNAIEVKNNGGTGVVGSTYVIRPQLRHLRIIPKNTAAYGLLLYNVQEFELDHVNIESGTTGYDYPTGTFTRSVVCQGCNTHGRIHDGNFTGSPVLIDLQYGLSPVTGNSSLKIYNMNLFNASTAAVKIGQVAGLSFGPGNYVESAQNAILIDNDNTNGQGAFVDGLDIHDNIVYNSGSTFYANALVLLLQHTTTNIGVLAHNIRLTNNVFNSDAGAAYMIKAMYATSTAPSNDAADFNVVRNDLWGGTTSALYSDSSKVVWRAQENYCLNHFWGSGGGIVDTFSGTAGGFTDYLSDGGGIVQSTQSNIIVKTTGVGTSITLEPKGNHGGVGPTHFTPGGTWHVKDATPATGVTQSIVEAGAGQGSTIPFIYYDTAGNDAFYLRPWGQVRIGSSTFAGLNIPNKPEVVYCSNCNVANPCTGGGSGAWAFYTTNGNKWVCAF